MATATTVHRSAPARLVRTWGRRVLVVVIMAWSLFPIYWALNTSLMPTSRAQQFPPPWLPFPVDTSNYRALLSDSTGASGQSTGGFWQAAQNTFIEAGLATAITIFLAILAAYAFTRLTFPGKKALLYVVLATLTVPVYAILIPLYRLMAQLHLTSSYLAIVLVDIASFMPLALWILYSYFESIPASLEEAAFVDGASPLTALWRVIVPVAMPGIVSAAVIVFLMAWGNFIFPLVLSASGATTPLTVWISSLQGRHVLPYTLLNAGGILAIVVPLVIVALLSRKIVAGLLAGSHK
jgi:multiple sugar transport system permease protein